MLAEAKRKRNAENRQAIYLEGKITGRLEAAACCRLIRAFWLGRIHHQRSNSMTTFQVICLKCGSEDVEINNVGSGYQLVCLGCNNWEDEE
jgi:hypothetical protein